MTTAPGRPIGDFTEDERLVLSGLEVHPALVTGDSHAFGVLPAYVRRRHDAQLAEVVAAAAAGSSGIAVLVGESSTGKTRALWEAMRTLPDDWKPWHPLPTRQDGVLDQLADLAPKTVIWLNEGQLYLTPSRRGPTHPPGLAGRSRPGLSDRRSMERHLGRMARAGPRLRHQAVPVHPRHPHPRQIRLSA